MKCTACWQAVGDGERLRVGQPDVFRREDDHSPDDEERVLAGLDHSRQPVERGVGVGAANRLDERRDGVVVEVGLLVVVGAAILQRRLDVAWRQ